MTVTTEQLEIATRIEAKMRQLLGAGRNDVQILAEMFDYMPGFKRLIDSGPEVLDELSEKFPSFHRFAKIVEMLAAALADGVFADLGFGTARPKRH